jgi:lipopolysaccharide biosynthesis protein
MIKPLAIYLPQYHSIPENDKAWGEGFTEWTNVLKAKPLFEGHYQPHIPHDDVGYYDLSDPEVMVRQAGMAKEFGIYGFAFYHYWFNGKRLLETPLDNMIKTGKPDFPFLYIWANENWTKRWDGLDNEIILKQEYSFDDDLNHIQFLCKNVFCDKRYITIDDKPVFIVYRTELFHDIKETVNIWRSEVRKYGFKDLYLIRVEHFRDDINPIEIGFDASMEFAPEYRSVDFNKLVIKDSNKIVDYVTTTENYALKLQKKFPWYRCVFPGWDNSPRRKEKASIYINNSPELFKQFLYRGIEYTKKHLDENSQFIFINSWNEWGEGCHIEPDKKYGFSFLNAVKNTIDDTSNKNQIEYIYFLEKKLSLKIEENKELKKLSDLYNEIMSSRGHRFVNYLLIRYRKLLKIIS